MGSNVSYSRPFPAVVILRTVARRWVLAHELPPGCATATLVTRDLKKYLLSGRGQETVLRRIESGSNAINRELHRGRKPAKRAAASIVGRGQGRPRPPSNSSSS